MAEDRQIPHRDLTLQDIVRCMRPNTDGVIVVVYEDMVLGSSVYTTTWGSSEMNRNLMNGIAEKIQTKIVAGEIAP